MKKLSLLLIVSSVIAIATAQELPDLDHALSIAKAQYPKVDSLDRIVSRLSHFEQHQPTKEQQEKLIQIYKAAANGYAANFHYKQGYQVYHTYLSLKERELAEEKTNVIEQAKRQYEEKNQNDEAEVQTMQSHANALNKDVDSLITRRLTFKRIFSAIIVLLSALFAASLFRSGVKLKALRDEVESNHSMLMQNHRIALLGSLVKGLKETINSNYEWLKKDVQELMGKLPKENENIKAIKSKLEELKVS